MWTKKKPLRAAEIKPPLSAGNSLERIPRCFFAAQVVLWLHTFPFFRRGGSTLIFFFRENCAALLEWSSDYIFPFFFGGADPRWSFFFDGEVCSAAQVVLWFHITSFFGCADPNDLFFFAENSAALHKWSYGYIFHFFSAARVRFPKP